MNFSTESRWLFCIKMNASMSPLYPRAEQVVGDERVEGVAAGAGDHQQQEDDQVDEREFAGHEGGAVVDDQQGDGHIDQDGDQGQAAEEADDDQRGAEYLGKDAKHQREAATHADRVGEGALQGREVEPLIEAVGEQETAQK